ncbi:hypothetical protein D3C76_1637520 [compost metagenome]
MADGQHHLIRAISIPGGRQHLCILQRHGIILNMGDLYRRYFQRSGQLVDDIGGEPSPLRIKAAITPERFVIL